MFTGIIQEIGTVIGLERGGESARLIIGSGSLSSSLRVGESLAVSGVCLTLVEVKPPRLVMDVSGETLKKTNLGKLASGEKVNLEPALKLGEELGGHLVTGHVDGVGELLSRTSSGRDWIFQIALSPGLMENVVMKGSLAVEGVSLTVAGVSPEEVTINIIPYTFRHTNLGQKMSGDNLNIETDLLGKYVARYLSDRGDLRSRISREFLDETGFLN